VRQVEREGRAERLVDMAVATAGGKDVSKRVNDLLRKR